MFKAQRTRDVRINIKRYVLIIMVVHATRRTQPLRLYMYFPHPKDMVPDRCASEINMKVSVAILDAHETVLLH